MPHQYSSQEALQELSFLMQLADFIEVLKDMEKEDLSHQIKHVKSSLIKRAKINTIVNKNTLLQKLISSGYGSSIEDIIKRAKDHIPSCDICLQTYTKYIEKKAHENLESGHETTYNFWKGIGKENEFKDVYSHENFPLFVKLEDRSFLNLL